ncbi:TonB-dependent receptor, partial [Aliiglaciecola sp. NS0011-25]|uniref:TonB-dependent receptor n=1 Tax=Aliiglaciecola sp. NS0011-25 TaxID=3127654 RepID=UPI00333F02E2
MKKSKISLALLAALYVQMPSCAFAQETSSENKAIKSEDAEQKVEVIEVSGIRSSLAHALQDKRNADSIVDGIAAEDIGKFPDQNVAESLQRISGVAISRENGEGSKLTIRGFGPEFNIVQLNGRTLATTDKGRSLDFQLLPSELISGAEVTKASTAKTPEGSIGGYVNVKTARPLNNPGFHAAGSTQVKHNDLSGDYSPQLSGIVSNTFLDDRFGVLVGFTHQENTNRIDTVHTNRWSTVKATEITGDIKDQSGNVITPEGLWYPGRYVFHLIEEERERTGLNLTFEFAQSDNMNHSLDYLFSDFKRQEVRQGMQVPLQRGGWRNVVASDNLTAIQAEKFGNHPLDGQFGESGETSTTNAIGYHFNAYVGNFTFDFDAFYSKAESTPITHNYVPNYVDNTQAPGNDILAYDLRGDGHIANFDTNIDFTDVANARGHFNILFDERLVDEVTEFKFDTNYEIDSGIFTSIDVGIAYSDREKIVDHYRIDSGCGNVLRICNKLMDLDDSLFAVNTTGDFLSEESGTFPDRFIMVGDISTYLDAIGVLRQEPNWTDKSFSEPRSTATDETKQSIYTQLNLAGDISDYAWSANVGLRYVEVETESRGFGVNRLSIAPGGESDGVSIDVGYSEPGQITRTNKYDEILPSVNFKMDFDNGFVTRFAGAKVISQPSITDIGVNRNYTDSRASNFSTSGGNPFLLPYEATQFDLTVEYYQDNGNSYAVNFFTKSIGSFIATQTIQDTTPSIYINGEEVDTTVNIPGFGTLTEFVTQKSNRSGGEIQGVELALLHYFDYLPGMLDGFGVQANYTYLDSEDKNAN